jgi:hypothetical protein
LQFWRARAQRGRYILNGEESAMPELMEAEMQQEILKVVVGLGPLS